MVRRNTPRLALNSVEQVADDQLDQGGERDLALAAQQGGRDVEADRHQEHEGAAREDSGYDRGREMPRYAWRGDALKTPGGGHERGVDPRHDAVQGETP